MEGPLLEGLFWGPFGLEPWELDVRVGALMGRSCADEIPQSGLQVESSRTIPQYILCAKNATSSDSGDVPNLDQRDCKSSQFTEAPCGIQQGIRAGVRDLAPELRRASALQIQNYSPSNCAITDSYGCTNS